MIIGAGINHWYHANLMYRAAIHALCFTGCVGVQRRRPGSHTSGKRSWLRWILGPAWRSPRDWYPASRLQNGPSWHYIHSDQWRYEKNGTDYNTVPMDAEDDLTSAPHPSMPT